MHAIRRSSLYRKRVLQFQTSISSGFCDTYTRGVYFPNQKELGVILHKHLRLTMAILASWPTQQTLKRNIPVSTWNSLNDLALSTFLKQDFIMVSLKGGLVNSATAKLVVFLCSTRPCQSACFSQSTDHSAEESSPKNAAKMFPSHGAMSRATTCEKRINCWYLLAHAHRIVTQITLIGHFRRNRPITVGRTGGGLPREWKGWGGNICK